MACRNRIRSALTAGVLMFASFLLQPMGQARAGLDDSASPTCPQASGLPQSTGHAVAFTGSLTCYRPGGPGFGGAATRAPQTPSDKNPTLGEQCSAVTYYPVTFSESAQGPQVVASFGSVSGPASSTRELNLDEALRAATQDAVVADIQTGTYQLSNPNDPQSALKCQFNPNYQRCPTAGVPFCFLWQGKDADLPIGSPPSPGPYLADAIGRLQGQAGIINSAPSHTGLVNQPVCFWIDGMGIPVEQDLTLVVAGPPDADGRQIFYTYLITIAFAGVQWNFDDGSSGYASAGQVPACGQHPQLTTHSYSQISDDRHPDSNYHVTAIEQYDISAHVWWVGSDGPHDEDVDPGVTLPPIMPPTYGQHVGQLEGVPVG